VNIRLANGLVCAWVRHRSRRSAVVTIVAQRMEQCRRAMRVLSTGLGGAILSTPVFAALRQAVPGGDIRLLRCAACAAPFANDTDPSGAIVYPGTYRISADRAIVIYTGVDTQSRRSIWELQEKLRAALCQRFSIADAGTTAPLSACGW